MKNLKLGVTGTRYGLNDDQRLAITAWLQKPFWNRDWQLVEFHHGDCLGADVEVAAIVRELHPLCHIVGHLPLKDDLRGFFESDDERKPLGYFARNRKIVEESNMLIGAPAHRNKSKGGTWYTINYARKNNVTTGIFHRDGKKEFRSEND